MITLRSAALFVLLVASFATACGASESDSQIPAADPEGAAARDGEPPLPPRGGETDAGVEEAGTDPDAGTDGGREPTELGLSAGCGKAGATGVASPSITVGGKKREFLRFVPAGYKQNDAMALVLGLHGSGGTSAKARAQFGLEPEAAGKAIFVYPQALPSSAPGFEGVNRWDSNPSGNDQAFLVAVVDAIGKSYCVDRDRVYITGFSNGAEITATIGCHHGDLFRAIAPLAPGGKMKNLPASGAGCIGEVAVLTGVGADDADHQFASALVRDFYRTANGCAATRQKTTPKACEAYDACRAGVPTTWCSYPGGHAWPPFGAAAVWAFFDGLK